MRRKSNYKLAHNVAKTIVTSVVIFLMVLDMRVWDIIAVIVWFWSVNPVAWVVEELLHLKHKHNIF